MMPMKSLPPDAALLAGVEAGGTKWRCLVGAGPGQILADTLIPTTTPEQTLAQLRDFLDAAQQQWGPLAAIGVASFGPVDLHPRSQRYGFITNTPKPGWAFTDVAGFLRRHFGTPVGFDTDVNGAALGEWRWGAARGLDTFVYLTVGTGIGGGGIVGGRLMHGLIHPEMGHMRVARDPARDPFPGICPFHHDCLEGLASGPALAARWGRDPRDLPPDHPAWALEADYLAQALHTLICILSPQRIILGGGVMQQTQLYPMIRERVRASLAGYLEHPALDQMDRFITAPELGARSGALGALILAERALRGANP